MIPKEWIARTLSTLAIDRGSSLLTIPVYRLISVCSHAQLRKIVNTCVVSLAFLLLLTSTWLAKVWEGFARFLVQQFSATRQIVTTAHDPLFNNEEYNQFLSSLGYGPVAKAAYGKSLR